MARPREKPVPLPKHLKSMTDIPKGVDITSTPHGSTPPGSNTVTEAGEEVIDRFMPVHALSPIEYRFCVEYLIDLNATRAYMRAHPEEITAGAAAEMGSRLLSRSKVIAEIQRLMSERAIATGIDANRVLVRLWQLATADHRELTELRLGACRYCWGEYHLYQYTEREFERAEAKHIHEQANLRKKAIKEDKEFEPTEFKGGGGTGFHPNRGPNPDCPECFGRGEPMPVMHDTRNLTPGAAMLYAGVKITKDAIEYRTHDQLAALQLVGRHLGMWNDKITPVDSENPLMALLKQIAEASGTTLSPVHNDPEALGDRVNEVQDVKAKNKKKAIEWKPITQKVG